MKAVQFELIGFTAAQASTLKLAIDMIMQRITDHFYQANVLNKKPTDYIACASKYAKTELQPTGLAMTVNAAQGAEAMITQLFQLMEYHNRTGVPAKITAYNSSNQFNTGRATIGSYLLQPSNNMDVNVNTVALDYAWSDKTEVFASTLFHEWAHRVGFVHPNGGYTDQLINEADQCMRRNNRDKTALVGLEPMMPEAEISNGSQNPGSSLVPMCFYEHKKDTKGGRKGSVTLLDANGQSKSCDANGDWKTICKDGKGDTDEVSCKLPGNQDSGSSKNGMCQYKHNKDTKGGKSGQSNAFDVNGQSKSCDKNGNWKNSCKDGNGDTDEVSCS